MAAVRIAEILFREGGRKDLKGRLRIAHSYRVAARTSLQSPEAINSIGGAALSALRIFDL